MFTSLLFCSFAFLTIGTTAGSQLDSEQNADLSAVESQHHIRYPKQGI
jgi:hypothetical protein